MEDINCESDYTRGIITTNIFIEHNSFGEEGKELLSEDIEIIIDEILNYTIEGYENYNAIVKYSILMEHVGEFSFKVIATFVVDYYNVEDLEYLGKYFAEKTVDSFKESGEAGEDFDYGFKLIGYDFSMKDSDFA